MIIRTDPVIFGLILLFSFIGFNFMLFYVIYWIIQKIFVSLPPNKQ